MVTLFLVKTNITSKSQGGQEIKKIHIRKQLLQIVIQTNNQCQKKAPCSFFPQKTGIAIHLFCDIYRFPAFDISDNEEEGQFEPSVDAPRMMSESPINKSQPLPEARSLFIFSHENS